MQKDRQTHRHTDTQTHRHTDKFKCKFKLPFFSKYEFFEVVTHPVNSIFSAVVRIYKILVDEAFFSKFLFLCFLVKH